MIETMRHALRHYQEVYLDGLGKYWAKQEVIIKFRGHFYRFEQFNEVIQIEERVNWLNITSEPVDDQYDLILHHYYEPSIRADGFQLKIEKQSEIIIKTSNLRGFRYAFDALKQLFIQHDTGIELVNAEVNHEPSFEMRGVIEGFYGVPWVQADRIDLLHYLGKHRMNTYMYAPKDDELQRKRWREHYGADKLAEFTELLDVAEAEQIAFYYMISPGNDIDYTQTDEVAVLTGKLQTIIDLGVRHFGLLLDDIDYILKDNAKKRFKNAASAHAYLIRKVDDFLAATLSDYTLVVCPTEYDNALGSEYLDHLTQAVPQHIPFFWTGPSTLARSITTEAIAQMSGVYQRPMVIWDNTPVNDYQADHELLLLSPYENRSANLADPRYQVMGIVSNPMAQWELSKLTVGHMGHYLWNSSGFNFMADWHETLEELAGTDLVEALKTFADYNPNRHTREVFTQRQLAAIQAKNVAYISQCVTELTAAANQLRGLEDERLRSQLLPWLERVEADANFWQTILTGDTLAIAKHKAELVGSAHRIGRDLPMAYVNAHQLDKE